MQFKDAAFEILKKSGKALHYQDITEQALKAGILTTSGQTPHASMGALLYTDTLKPDSRFRRGEQKGTFELKTAEPSDIDRQIERLNHEVRSTLKKRLLKMEPRKFEELIRTLLTEMGFQETTTTSFAGDGGIDVRGILHAERLSQINLAVQAKRWKANVSAKVVRELRGSLKVHEQGVVITPSGFTKQALAEAEEAGKSRISLVDGDQLVDLLIEHQVGAIKEVKTVYSLDKEYWTEILGADPQDVEAQSSGKTKRTGAAKQYRFPLPIRAVFQGTEYFGELIDIDGRVRYQGTVYATVSGAAKAVAVTWPAVNGWDFWRYFDLNSGKWVRIGKLRAER